MILIHAYAQALRTGMPNAKSYPWWPELIARLGHQRLVQVGVAGDAPLVPDFRANLPLRAVRELVELCDYWIAVDSFLPHLAHHVPKPGVVLWGPSDPEIFGYVENLNILRDRRCLRAKQFKIWEEHAADPDAFVPAIEAAEQIARWRASQREPLRLVDDVKERRA